MTKQTIKRQLPSMPVVAVIALMSGLFLGAAVAQVKKSIGERYGSREPRTCEDMKAPAKGPITAALALKYLNCQMEKVSGDLLYLVENVKVEVGSGIPYSAIRGRRSFTDIDVKHPVYPIRGSLVRYQCNVITGYATLQDQNCSSYNEPKATGHCYKTTFGDWKCYMSDSAATDKENVRHNVAPPKSGKNGVADKAANNKPTDTKNAEPTAQTEDKADIDRDENGFVKPDFSEMEKYFEIVKYDYSPVDGRFTLVVKAKKETNIFRWYLTAYDADGAKLSENSFNGNSVTPVIGEPTRIYSFAPNEKTINQVTRIAFTRKLD